MEFIKLKEMLKLCLLHKMQTFYLLVFQIWLKYYWPEPNFPVFSIEGREGVKWELGFAFFRGWEMEFCALGLGFKKKNNRKMGMGFQFE